MFLHSAIRMVVIGVVLTTTFMVMTFANALTPSMKTTTPLSCSSTTTTTAIITTTRRAFFHQTLATASTVVGLGSALFPDKAAAATDKDGINVLLGTYTDPNHPGGTRTIALSGTGFGNFQLAKITGGGGQGEPASFELNGMISPCPGNSNNNPAGAKWCITIDFSPKGGPSEFTGFYDQVEKGIRFPVDGNFWPKQ